MVAGGHNTTTPSSLTYYSVVSRYRVRIALKFSAVNYLKVLAYNIQNGYLTEKCRENIWTVVGTEFIPEQGMAILVLRTLYVLKLSRAAFRDLLSEHLYELGYRL